MASAVRWFPQADPLTPMVCGAQVGRERGHRGTSLLCEHAVNGLSAAPCDAAACSPACTTDTYMSQALWAVLPTLARVHVTAANRPLD